MLRACIEKVLDDGRFKVFFNDYGTFAIVNHEDTSTNIL